MVRGGAASAKAATTSETAACAPALPHHDMHGGAPWLNVEPGCDRPCGGVAMGGEARPIVTCAQCEDTDPPDHCLAPSHKLMGASDTAHDVLHTHVLPVVVCGCERAPS